MLNLHIKDDYFEIEDHLFVNWTEKVSLESISIDGDELHVSCRIQVDASSEDNKKTSKEGGSKP